MSTSLDELKAKVAKTANHHARQVAIGGRRIRCRLRPPVVRRPVFVVGCSRAGTTLVYKLLSVAAELGSLQRESHDYWAALHPPAERGWASHAVPAAAASAGDRRSASEHFYVHTGRRRFVDKNNQAGLSIPYLRALFPDATFVYVKRSPGDNLNSLIEGWRRPEEFATWSGDVPAQVRIDGGRFRRWCFFLPEGWRAYLDAEIEEVCALQYRSINAAILAARDDAAGERWVELPYEELLADPRGRVQRLFADCGLGLTKAVQRRCAEALAVPYNPFSRIATDKWRRSENAGRIERVLPSVVAVAGAMGYDSDAPAPGGAS